MWSALYAGIWASSTAALCELRERGEDGAADAYARALAANLALNAGWSLLFFRAHRLQPATVVAGALAVSAADLARRAAPTGRGKAVTLAAYAGWCSFATVLTG